MNTIAKQIRAMREAAGMSLTTLAEKSSVNRMTLHRIEQGGDVRLQTLDDVLKVLGVEVALVPRALRNEVQQFIQAGGKLLGRPAGVEAPPSVIAVLTSMNREAGEHAHHFARKVTRSMPTTQSSFVEVAPVQTSQSGVMIVGAGDHKISQAPSPRHFTVLPDRPAEFVPSQQTDLLVQGSMQDPRTHASGTPEIYKGPLQAKPKSAATSTARTPPQSKAARKTAAIRKKPL